MPSGSKRRKAAKKKKENQSSDHPNPSSASAHSHGGDDVKHQDDKEIDVGEVSSPDSQGHHSHQNLLAEWDEEEIEAGESISNIPSVEGVKIEVVDEPNKMVEESIIPVEREFKIEDESDKKDGSSSGSSSSSTSSSDDESHGINNSQTVPDIGSIVDSVKVTDSLSGGQDEVIHSTTIEETHDSVEENIADTVSVNVQSLREEPEVSMCSPANNSVPPPIVESIFNGNGEKKLSSFEAKVGISEALHDAGSQREEAVITSVENISAIPDPKECVAQETDDRLNLSYNAPIAIADHGADPERDSAVTEPLLAPTSYPVQTTSWKSCCGLFEVFTGSGR